MINHSIQANFKMPTILISGARAAGLGHGFLTHYASDPSNTIIAIDRAPIAYPPGSHASITMYPVDITSQTSIENFAMSIKDIAIDLFIHSIGVRGLVPSIESQYPHDVATAETFQVMDTTTMLNTFHINTAGTFSILQALLPSLRLANKKGGQAKVVIMGSRMGSISYNTTGSAYAYRASKAALNAVIKSFSIDVPDVLFTTLHPGRVETGLVMTKEEGAISVEESVQDMLKVIERMDKADSGKFYDRFGELIGW
jgi:NAD(P)-dependent dehydrogenase (short-subunit alcohol dehydrogenase family)